MQLFPTHPRQVLADGPIIIEVLRTGLFSSYGETIGNSSFSFFPIRAAGSRIIYIGKRPLPEDENKYKYNFYFRKGQCQTVP